MSKVKVLTSEEIEAKKDELKAKINDSKKRAMAGRLSPAKDFLSQISDIIKDALKNNVSYKQLTKDIFDVYSFKVSEQTLRSFAQNALGVAKQKRRVSQAKTDSNNATAPVENKVLSANNDQNSTTRIKADLEDF